MDDPDWALPVPPSPLPVHRAIDLTSAALLRVQRVRRQLERHEDIASDLDGVEQVLRELGELLIEIRDAPA